MFKLQFLFSMQRNVKKKCEKGEKKLQGTIYEKSLCVALHICCNTIFNPSRGKRFSQIDSSPMEHKRIKGSKNRNGVARSEKRK